MQKSLIFFTLSSLKSGPVLEKGGEHKIQEGGNSDGNTESLNLNQYLIELLN
jgi:hypothetical protein